MRPVQGEPRSEPCVFGERGAGCFGEEDESAWDGLNWRSHWEIREKSLGAAGGGVWGSAVETVNAQARAPKGRRLSCESARSRASPDFYL